jgi:hypothetical protein
VVTNPPNGWQVRDGAEPLYEVPLGSETTVHDFWSSPAVALRLTLLSWLLCEGSERAIFVPGWHVVRLMAELGRLEAHWSRAVFDAETRADLREHAGWMRVALGLAEGSGAWVRIAEPALHRTAVNYVIGKPDRGVRGR